MSSPFRFALLEHDWPHLHLDLLLEWGGSLLTWRLPAEILNFPMRATSLDRHRIAYLEYEGPISNNRGSVRRVDRGGLRWLVMTEVLYLVELEGERLNGRYRLHKANSDWLLHQG